MGTIRTNMDKKFWIMRKIDDMGICGLGISENFLIADFCLIFNSQRKTIMEMLRNFEEGKRVLRKEGKIYSLKWFNENGEVINFPEVKTEVEIEADKILNENTDTTPKTL